MQTIQFSEGRDAFGMESRALSHIKDALRITVRWQVPNSALEQKLSSVRFTLRSLQRHMARLMELEESDDYLKPILREHNPNLFDRMERLLGEHEQFRTRLARVIEAADSVERDGQLALEHVCDAVTMLLEQIEEHEHAESELIQQAMLVDEGGEG